MGIPLSLSISIYCLCANPVTSISMDAERGTSTTEYQADRKRRSPNHHEQIPQLLEENLIKVPRDYGKYKKQYKRDPHFCCRFFLFLFFIFCFFSVSECWERRDQKSSSLKSPPRFCLPLVVFLVQIVSHVPERTRCVLVTPSTIWHPIILVTQSTA